MEKSVSGKIISVLLGIVSFLGILFIGFTIWCNLSATCMVASLNEHVYFIVKKGNTIIPIVFTSLFVLFGSLAFERVKKIDEFLCNKKAIYNLIFVGMVAVMAALSIGWVLSTRFQSMGDPLSVMEAANGLISGDYSSFAKDGYVGMCTNQIGLVLIESFAYSVLGVSGNLAFQLFNAVCITLTFVFISLFVKKGVLRLLCIFAGIIWYPFIMYSSFVYGMVPGLCVALGAFVVLIKGYEAADAKVGKQKDITKVISSLVSALLIAFSCVIKSNYFIFLIAYIIIAIVIMVGEKNRFAVLAICLSLLFSFGFMKLQKPILKAVAGIEVGDGITNIAYITMGLQEGSYAPGWFNFYNWNVYNICEGDGAAQSQMARNDMIGRIDYMAHNRRYTADFFTKKIASMWSDPYFESTLSLKKTEMNVPKAYKYLISAKGSDDMIWPMKLFQILVYVGSLISVFLLHKATFGGTKNREKALDTRAENYGLLALVIIYIGGFLFHIFWEGKSQYALPYFILLIPVAIKGFAMLMREIYAMMHRKEKIEISAVVRSNKISFAAIAILVIMVIIILCMGVTVSRPGDTLEYTGYITEFGYNPLWN